MMAEKKVVTNFNLTLDKFDGPLDLLDTLIRNHKMDIMQIDVSLIASQYLEFIQEHKNEAPIDTFCQYLNLATYLLELKAKKMLPILSEEENAQFEYERDKLVQQLIVFRQYKQAIEEMKKKKEIRDKMIAKPEDDLENYMKGFKIKEALPSFISPEKIQSLMKNILEKYRFMNTKKNIMIQELLVTDLEDDVMEYLTSTQDKITTYTSFLLQVDPEKITVQYVITTFLALLELVKYHKISISMDETKEIHIKLIEV